jgi:hypothetical protein
VSTRWRDRRTSLQKTGWARLEDQGWTLAIIGRDGGDILVSASRGGERASLRLKKDGTVHDLSAEEPAIVHVPSPSIRYLSESDAKARKLGY